VKLGWMTESKDISPPKLNEGSSDDFKDRNRTDHRRRLGKYWKDGKVMRPREACYHDEDWGGLSLDP